MSLLEQIKADSLSARKTGQKLAATLLTTLYSEAANVGKNKGNRQTTDEEVVAVVKKFIKGVDETITYLNKGDDNIDALNTAIAEKAILVKYTPTQLDEQALSNVISLLVDTLPDRSPKQMGTVMKMLKEKHEGQYDGKLASSLIKAALN